MTLPQGIGSSCFQVIQQVWMDQFYLFYIKTSQNNYCLIFSQVMLAKL